MKLGKILNGTLQLLPHMIIVDDMKVFNPTEEHAKKAGYKEIINKAMPEEPAPEGQHYESHYEDKGANIEQVWELVDNKVVPPQPPTLEERIIRLEENQIEMENVTDTVVFVSALTAQSYSDKTALKVKDIYPKWEDLCRYDNGKGYYAEQKGYKFTYEDVLYKTLQDKFTFQEQWKPSKGTGSIYTRIDESYAGALEDPIPVPDDVTTNPFTYVVGKYYLWNEKVYKCEREGEEDGTEHSFNYSPDQVAGYFVFVKIV